MELVGKMLVMTLSVFLSDYLFDGVEIKDFTTALGIGIILTLLNKYIKPLIILLTIPFTLFTLGFFLLIINTSLVFLTAHFIDGFTINGFWTGFFFSIVISLIASFLEALDKNRKKVPPAE